MVDWEVKKIGDNARAVFPTEVATRLTARQDHRPHRIDTAEGGHRLTSSTSQAGDHMAIAGDIMRRYAGTLRALAT